MVQIGVLTAAGLDSDHLGALCTCLSMDSWEQPVPFMNVPVHCAVSSSKLEPFVWSLFPESHLLLLWAVQGTNALHNSKMFYDESSSQEIRLMSCHGQAPLLMLLAQEGYMGASANYNQAVCVQAYME